MTNELVCHSVKFARLVLGHFVDCSFADVEPADFVESEHRVWAREEIQLGYRRVSFTHVVVVPELGMVRLDREIQNRTYQSLDIL